MRTKTRTNAAIYSLAQPLGILGIFLALANIGGRDAFLFLFHKESVARPNIIFLVVSLAFSIVLSITLFSALELSRKIRLTLVVLVVVQFALATKFASITCVFSALILWPIFKLYREASA